MPNSITIKNFEEIYSEFEQKLTDYGSEITNFGGGGAYDLLIRISCLMLADAYQIIQSILNLGFIQTATGEWLDLKAGEVGLTRLDATKTQKQFWLKRASTAPGVKYIDIGGIIQSPVIPNRGRQRWFSLESAQVPGYAGKFTDALIETGSATTGSVYGILYDTSATFQTNNVQVGDLIRNTTKSVDLRVVSVYSEIILTCSLMDGSIPTSSDGFDVGDNYEIRKRSDKEVLATFDADLPGAAYNEMETLLGVPGQAVEMEIVSGLDPVDEAWSNGEDLIPGADDETDAELRERIISRWAELAAGSTKAAYISFAKNSSTGVYDAFVTENRPGGPTGVEIVLSGPPGARDISDELGINASTINFLPNYTDDGTVTGDPRPFGDIVHNYIRAKMPLTDFLYLKSVLEEGSPHTDLDVDVTVEEGYDVPTVKANVITRLKAFFTVQASVDDVEILVVGEALLFSKLCLAVGGTEGVTDFSFNTPSPGNDISCDEEKVLVLGDITVGDM